MKQFNIITILFYFTFYNCNSQARESSETTVAITTNNGATESMSFHLTQHVKPFISSLPYVITSIRE